MFDVNSFNDKNIPANLKTTLAKCANLGLCKDTWSNYKTAVNQLKRCHEETGVNIDYPLSESSILTFVSWNIGRGIKSSTISSYLSGLRESHLAKGMEAPKLRNDVTNLILKGNGRKKSKKLAPKRLPCTLNILRILKVELKRSSLKKTDKLAVWAVSALCFYGSLRAGEVLGSRQGGFHKACTLLRSDLKFGEAKGYFVLVTY